MSNETPKSTKISWQAIVDKLDPKRKEPKPAYVFSNGRIFKDK